MFGSSPYGPTVTRRGVDESLELRVGERRAARIASLVIRGCGVFEAVADASAAGPICRPWHWMALAWPRPEDHVTGDRVHLASTMSS